MTITEKIKAIREAKRLTQLEVADALELERANYARIENKINGNNISYEFLEKIATVLGVSISEIINYPNKPQIAAEIDTERVKELEREVIILKETIDLLKQLNEKEKQINEQQKKIEKLRFAELMGVFAVVMGRHPEVANTIKGSRISKEEIDWVHKIKTELYNADSFEQEFEKIYKND
jgi:XRE family transcriptional regulator of biofilm formation